MPKLKILIKANQNLSLLAVVILQINTLLKACLNFVQFISDASFIKLKSVNFYAFFYLDRLQKQKL